MRSCTARGNMDDTQQLFTTTLRSQFSSNHASKFPFPAIASLQKTTLVNLLVSDLGSRTEDHASEFASPQISESLADN